MTLGSGFPPEYLRVQIQRQLKPGTVIKLVRLMDDGQQHEKRFVVLHVDERTITCVINSEISNFLKARPSMLQCQVAMSATLHNFMHHDSHVDCSRTRIYQTRSVIDDLVGNPGWLLGVITGALRDDMIAALKFAPTLSPAEVTQLCESLATLDKS